MKLILIKKIREHAIETQENLLKGTYNIVIEIDLTNINTKTDGVYTLLGITWELIRQRM